MKKFPLIIGLVTLVIIIGGIFMLSRGGNKDITPNPTSLEYYWLTTCPHCQNVADFMSTWPKKDQVSINKMEVNSNRDYSALLMQRGKTCGLDQQNLGSVPLMVTPEGKCYLGDTPIIDYLKTL
jgi:hypothetical protein